MKDTVLLIVDVQNSIMEEHPYQEEILIENLQKLIAYSRNNGIEIVYVRHIDEQGTELEEGSEGFQIFHKITPLDTDKIFNKRFNSAFRKTGLKEYLDSKNIRKIILTGMQTEYCIDATLKSAFDLDYEVINPEDTTSTVDNPYLTGKQLHEYFQYAIWNNRFAKVIPLEELLAK